MTDAHPLPQIPQGFKAVKRDGAEVAFDPSKMESAIAKAMLAGAKGGDKSAIPAKARQFAKAAITALMGRHGDFGRAGVEDIQDQAELALMRAGEHDAARAYVLYRESHAQARAAERAAALAQGAAPADPMAPTKAKLMADAVSASAGLPEVDAAKIADEALRNLYVGAGAAEVDKALLLAARSMIETEPSYSQACARLLMAQVAVEAWGKRPADQAALQAAYVQGFAGYVRRGVDAELLDPELAQFDLERLSAALDASRDSQLDFLGAQTLADRYLLNEDGVRFELPQYLFMRVAMGLSLRELDREAKAEEFYRTLSSFDFMSSTPTLFNSGTRHSQLSSCYLTTIPDDLDGIYEGIKENALLQKFAGGIGNDWTPVRAMGAKIKGTNGKSQGTIPFMKVANDTAVAVNQCFAPDTLVFTGRGPVAISEIVPGDLVCGQRGEYREVLETMSYGQTDPMVQIDVKHSIRPLRVTSGHPIWALRGVPMEQANARTYADLSKKSIKPEWVDAGELARGDFAAQAIPQEVVVAEGFTDDDALLYGVMLGIGRCSADGLEWSVSGQAQSDERISFVRGHLTQRGIRFSEDVLGGSQARVTWNQGEAARALPFDSSDLHGDDGAKRISARLSHLPNSQALALVKGLLIAGGCVSRGKEIHFTNGSEALVESLRYQLLRMGVPSSGQCRERSFDKGAKACGLRVPAIPEIASLVGAKAIAKRNWIEHGGCVFSRIRSVQSIAPLAVVHDLKVEGDPTYMTTAALVHNGGKRKGAVCAYLETWHLDIEEFLELRKNTGDERRRTPDMNTANWIPDLFMKRVKAGGEWTLLSPSDAPKLHDLWGKAFEAEYIRLEGEVDAGRLKLYKRVPALSLWRKMLTMLFETGHPWITFKDPCNVRSPQRHAGVVHSSNLCSEIVLNTSRTETAVCNLGSINLSRHMRMGAGGRMELDVEKVERTIKVAMRMLDNVVDINYYGTRKARDSNLRHRPVGLGMMGHADCLIMMGIPFASQAAVEFADYSTEAVCRAAYGASSDLAAERGTYSSYEGSLWSQGIFPQDSVALLAEERGGHLDMDASSKLDWTGVRAKVAKHGMRNSNCVAIAPTATISNIVGAEPCIEPIFQTLYVKSNMSGEFTVINVALVNALKKIGLWDEVMAMDLKHFDGDLAKIGRVPAEIQELFATVFKIDPKWLIEAGSRRQKWIDQSQSLNLYMAGANGKKIDEMYRMAWEKGLKTTYYLRTTSATSVEKSTSKAGALNAVAITAPAAATPAASPAPAPAPAPAEESRPATDAKFCSIDNPDCEACQ